MKKLIVLCGIVVIGCMAVLTQGEAKSLQERSSDRSRITVQLENLFERDETVNKLLQYLASVDKSNESDEERRHYIYVHREGSIAEMNLYGIENDTYKEQIEKVERVLGLEGLTDFIYNEAQIEKESLLLAGRKEEYGDICHSKYYDQAIVTVSAYKGDTYESDQMIQRSVRIQVPSEKIKDVSRAALAERLVEKGCYVSNIIQGGAKEVLVLVNADTLAATGVYNYKANESGEMEPVDLMNIRYEVLMEGDTPEAVKVILESRGELKMNESDKAVFTKAAKEIGLNEEELKALNELVTKTLEKPSKNQNQKLGAWQYHSQYTNSHSEYKGGVNYLEINLNS